MMSNSVSVTARLSGVSPSTVRNYCDKGIIEARRNARGWRYISDPIKAAQTLRELFTGEKPPDEKTDQN